MHRRPRAQGRQIDIRVVDIARWDRKQVESVDIDPVLIF